MSFFQIIYLIDVDYLARVENMTNGQTHKGGWGKNVMNGHTLIGMWVENMTNGQTHRGKKGDGRIDGSTDGRTESCFLW